MFKKFLLLSILLLTIFASSTSLTYAIGGQDDFQSNPNAQLAPSDCGNSGQRECGWGDMLSFINRIIKFIIYFSSTLAVLAFCYAGFLYLTAFGEMGKVEEAHNIFRTTIIGMIIIMLAWLIVATIIKSLGVKQDFTILDTGNVETVK